MANLHLFFIGESAPDGWSLVSDTGGTFLNRYIRGSSTYTTGGTASHTHTFSWSCGNSSGTVACTATGTTTAVSITESHTHTVGTVALSTENNMPSYYTLMVIKYDSGEPTTIPRDTIAMFDDTPPTGWTKNTNGDGYFIRGAATSETTDSVAHTHTVTGATGTGGDSGTRTVWASGTHSYGCEANHTHTLSGTSSESDFSPPYINICLASKDSDGELTVGMIGMFDDTPSDKWEILSGVGGDFYQKYIHIDSTDIGGTGGAATHTHDNITPSYTQPTIKDLAYNALGSTEPAKTHTHVLSMSSLNSVDNDPSRVDVIIAKYIYVAPTPTECDNPGRIAISSSQISTTNERNGDTENTYGNEIRLKRTCS